ncbi:MAG: nitroreductase family protein [Sideroxydans sp.]|nr:nitroreductase family protein [Sideroxydans sp.]
MNPTLQTQLHHRSIRSFKDEAVSDEMLAQIIAAAHQAPTSMNAQEISLVVVRDAERRARIAELTGGMNYIAQAPVFIAIIIDFNKTDLALRNTGKTQLIHESMEGFGVGAVDAGIVLGTMIAAAESLGLGIVPIGGIRRDPQGIVDLLALPPLTFAVVGLCIGHIAIDAPVKPRLNISTFRHDERYDASSYSAAIAAYDATLMQHWQNIGRSDGTPWSTSLAPFQSVYYPAVRPVAAMQGLLNDK